MFGKMIVSGCRICGKLIAESYMRSVRFVVLQYRDGIITRIQISYKCVVLKILLSWSKVHRLRIG